MIDYVEGDVVVCIDDTPLPFTPPPVVTKGKIYKAIEIDYDPDGEPVVNVNGLIEVLGAFEYWHCAKRFKRLPEASEEFKAAMAAIKIRESEPV